MALECGLSRYGTGEGNGTPLQCSCLENPRDGGAWWAAVYGVAQSRTRLKRLSSSCGTQVELLHSMWKLPGPKIELMPPTLIGGILVAVPPRKSSSNF